MTPTGAGPRRSPLNCSGDTIRFSFSRRLVPMQQRVIDDVVPFRGGAFVPRDVPLAGAAALLGLVVLWQIGDSTGLIPTLFLPSPANIAVALYHLTLSGELWKHLSAS